ncbi:hypothetical protein NUU61_001796 [Penicillium alfredii]|uniref:Orn/DAP/Arg decarboxylase 2 N-terminal domain-containing protein n=1 Tax=Penicillium alfredii TaxID=1506179 RepID=A0A9W9FQI8_9EURO|nr:uncharacterized protein NUU61_001796 [Penicillium alfredii]KAJ5104449.1 hypothetical protein NUU61_001796 [Penicillium alfredii]
MGLLPASRELVFPGTTSKAPLLLRGVPEYHKPSPEELVDLAIESHIARVNKHSLAGGDESFFVADLGQVTRQHRRWTQSLPGVRPYYDPTLLKLLADLGTGFDCASIEEIRAVLNQGVDPARILFANPCKSPAALVYARQAGVIRTTFDNLDELDNIKAHMPEAQLLLRIYANDDGALICLGEKFGAHLDTVQPLLSRAWELELDVIGVSFHVGTGATNPTSFAKAINHARLVFTQAQRLGFTPTILDIGGGFVDSHFEPTASLLRETIRAEFPAGVTVIAEPGRFYARSAYTLACRVISRRRQLGSAAAAGVPDMLYQNDGVYGNFMNVIMEKEVMGPSVVEGTRGKDISGGKCEKDSEDLSSRGISGAGEQRYSIWGPTCDSIDCVVRETTLEREVAVGDWLKYRNMGAYTSTTATQFNGFSSSHDILYVNSESLPEY